MEALLLVVDRGGPVNAGADWGDAGVQPGETQSGLVPERKPARRYQVIVWPR